MPLRRWLLNVMLALGVAIVLIPFPPSSRAQEGCVPLEQAQPLIEALPTFRILQGKAKERAIAFFNSSPPPSDIPWPSAYFAIRDDGFGVLMVGGENSICDGVLIVPSMVLKVLAIIDLTGV